MIEIYLFIIELTNLGYLEKTGEDYNIVVITENGHKFLNNWNSIQDRYYKR
jgi:predicted transcriptional regulator